MDQHGLTTEQRAELFKSMASVKANKRLDPNKITRFIDLLSNDLAVLEITGGTALSTDVRDSLVNIINGAAALVKAMDLLHPEASSLLQSAASRTELSGSLHACCVEGIADKHLLLSFFIEIVEDIAKVANEAALMVETSPQDKPDQNRARQITRRVAVRYREVFGRLPPNYDGCWTLSFLDDLGTIFRVKKPMGRTLVKGVIDKLK